MIKSIGVFPQIFLLLVFFLALVSLWTRGKTSESNFGPFVMVSCQFVVFSLTGIQLRGVVNVLCGIDQHLQSVVLLLNWVPGGSKLKSFCLELWWEGLGWWGWGRWIVWNMD